MTSEASAPASSDQSEYVAPVICPLRAWTLVENWMTWLQCQPGNLRQKWPDPASWLFWHVEVWRNWLDGQPVGSQWRKWHGKEEECARWECALGVQSLPEGSDWQLTSTDHIEVIPFDVLFTQGNISSSFGPHPHEGIHVDETIISMIAAEMK